MPASAPLEHFEIAAIFDAPRELVWKAWTMPEYMSKWFGPKGFKGKAHKLDFRPGGIYHYSLTSPDGKEMWGKFVYREIEPMKKIVFVNSFSDAEGGLTRHPMNPNWPAEMLSTITFEESGSGTKVTVQWSPIDPSEAERQTFVENTASMQQGWTGTFDQLADYLVEAKKGQAA